VEELLVVTFTEAATEELRGRIRSNIHELRIACLRDSATDPLYSACWRKSPIRTRRRRRCCWLNGRWTKRRYLPFTAFASGC
jgi:ATP-dependent exoDNAse (exonuclease V) beta subunit